MKTSPTPWKAHEFEGQTVVRDADGWIVCMTSKESAGRIVRAANNHERLVKAMALSRRMLANVVERIPEKSGEHLDLSLVLNMMGEALSELEQEAQ